MRCGGDNRQRLLLDASEVGESSHAGYGAWTSSGRLSLAFLPGGDSSRTQWNAVQEQRGVDLRFVHDAVCGFQGAYCANRLSLCAALLQPRKSWRAVDRNVPPSRCGTVWSGFIHTCQPEPFTSSSSASSSL